MKQPDFLGVGFPRMGEISKEPTNIRSLETLPRKNMVLQSCSKILKEMSRTTKTQNETTTHQLKSKYSNSAVRHLVSAVSFSTALLSWQLMVTRTPMPSFLATNYSTHNIQNDMAHNLGCSANKLSSSSRIPGGSI